MAGDYDAVYFLVRWIVRNAFFRPLGGIRALHEARVPRSGALILAANHVSFADPPAAACATRRRLRFMAKAELFRVRLLGAVIRRLGAYPVRRGEADTEAVRETLRHLERGEAVLVFPEGGRGVPGTLGPANRGIALLASRSRAPVMPVGLCGTADLLPRGAKLPRRARVAVAFGEPILFADFEERLGRREASRRFGPEVMERIAALLAEAGFPARPDAPGPAPHG